MVELLSAMMLELRSPPYRRFEGVFPDHFAPTTPECSLGKRAEKSPPPDDPHDPNRTGLFTSGVVATRAGRRIAIFFSGRQHAGENLSAVLQHRAAELDAPIQMCDGLSRNLPQELATMLANCLSHGRRKFADLVDRFTDQCRYVIDALKVVYHNDQVARETEMSADERLAYHQAHSQSTMDDLKTWLQRQFEEKVVEPNSALGDAISYLLKRWDALTLFLHKAGAPLDNNLCERALKKAILHRNYAKLQIMRSRYSATLWLGGARDRQVRIIIDLPGTVSKTSLVSAELEVYAAV